jgi:single-strand DNA-binding protein
MAGSFNKVMLLGNLTRDPELRHLPNTNTAVTNIGIAVNRRYRTQSGENREEVTFVDCEAFGRTAEVMSQYLAKGRPVFIEGRLKLDQWQDRDGNNRSKLKVFIENFQFVDSQGGGGGGAGGGGGGGRSYSDHDQGGAGQSYGGGGDYGSYGGSQQGGANISEDDIPF